MLVELIPSGISWVDATVGGYPAKGIVAVAGASGTGKSSFALSYLASVLGRGRTCFLTSDAPEAVIEATRTTLEVDLRPSIADGRLTLLGLAPFFANKVKSLGSVAAPLAELRELLFERHIQHVIFDTMDPLLSWIDPATAGADVREIVEQIRAWQVSVLCTLSGTAVAVEKFGRTSSGFIELQRDKLRVSHAGWCNVYGVEAPFELVQGRGVVVRGSAVTPSSSTATVPDNLPGVVAVARRSSPEIPASPGAAAPLGVQSLIYDGQVKAFEAPPTPPQSEPRLGTGTLHMRSGARGRPSAPELAFGEDDAKGRKP